MGEYKAKLAKRLRTSILTAYGDEWNAHSQAIEERETALFDHFGIDRSSPDAWRELAIALAQRHVPAFMSEPGRPATVRVETIKWFLASFYFQRRDRIGQSDADRLVAAHFDADTGNVMNRLKELRRRADYKQNGPLLTMITKVETEFGRSAMLDALGEVLVFDPNFVEYIESEAEKLRRHPY